MKSDFHKIVSKFPDFGFDSEYQRKKLLGFQISLWIPRDSIGRISLSYYIWDSFSAKLFPIASTVLNDLFVFVCTCVNQCINVSHINPRSPGICPTHGNQPLIIREEIKHRNVLFVQQNGMKFAWH